ncbi:hypothetical protein LJB96_03525 [Methanobrevibacter sp. OttesenSCG-928-K11]|nr:hypothetical protein [Methanobrevibacter sp. OttesenSCG-928-K11]MDL2270850.1 hypothetical protein [Methanobrevibacter sp. OttesenSCG-928-I08]
MKTLELDDAKHYPIKWICNLRGQKAIGICGYSQKIAMFAHDERVPNLIQDILIGTNKDIEGYGCEEKDRCCNFECEYCEITNRQYLQITGKKPSKKAIKELETGLKSLNQEIEHEKYVPFDEYEVIKL